jgi:hypothetical protein
MKQREIALGLVQPFMDPLVLKNITLNSFEIIKDDWVDETLKESRADIRYRTKLLNQNEWINFLFEHKSIRDKKTPSQSIAT